MDRLHRWLERSRELGFLGPGPVEPHVRHAEGFAAPVGRLPAQVLDLGSGGGLPGLVLAQAWPESAFVLLDSNERRTAFLVEAVADLGWAGRVRVERARAEVVGRDETWRGRFDLVVSRSFGPPAVTAECAAPFLQVEGCLVVSEPPPDDYGERWPTEGLHQLGLVAAERVPAGGASFQVLRQARPCPDRYPRRAGVPSKRPLW